MPGRYAGISLFSDGTIANDKRHVSSLARTTRYYGNTPCHDAPRSTRGMLP
jgi:hypothetical protein